jgi:hypothetical protein
VVRPHLRPPPPTLPIPHERRHGHACRQQSPSFACCLVPVPHRQQNMNIRTTRCIPKHALVHYRAGCQRHQRGEGTTPGESATRWRSKPDSDASQPTGISVADRCTGGGDVLLYPLRTLGNDGRLPGPVAAAFASGRGRCNSAGLGRSYDTKQKMALQSGLRHLRGRSPSIGAVSVPTTLSPLYPIAMIGGAFGAMMLLASGKSPKKRRFLMIAYSAMKRREAVHGWRYVHCDSAVALYHH